MGKRAQPVGKKASPKGKAILKRPAAKAAARPVPTNAVCLDGKFNLKKYVKEVMDVNRLRFTDKSTWNPLQLTTSCSGAGTVTHVLESMLGRRYVNEVFACEKSKSACVFLLKNFNPGCIFEDCRCLQTDMSGHI